MFFHEGRFFAQGKSNEISDTFILRVVLQFKLFKKKIKLDLLDFQ
jgi:hypothetical protein